MSIQDDASKILEYVADFLDEGADPDDRGHYSLTGHGVQNGVGLSPNRINMAANFLENRGLVELDYRLGTSPYDFGGIKLTAEGRAFVDQCRCQKDDASKELVIVLFAANPDGTSMLALDKEVRGITDKIQASALRAQVRFVPKWAVRPDDLLQTLNEIHPHVVHFSGHGNSTGNLVLHGAGEQAKEVTPDAMAFLFRTMKDNVRLVLINACFGDVLAKAVTQYVDCAIGVPNPISDAAAQLFAASFYRALGFGRTVGNAFEQGLASLSLEGIPESEMPKLFVKDGVDATKLILLDDPQGHG